MIIVIIGIIRFLKYFSFVKFVIIRFIVFTMVILLFFFRLVQFMINALFIVFKETILIRFYHDYEKNKF